MKKALEVLIPIILLIIVSLFICIFFDKNTEKIPSEILATPNELSNFEMNSFLDETIEKMPYEVITELSKLSSFEVDSFLDILVDARTFNNDEINYEDMLEIAMRISSKLNLVKTTEPDSTFYEYVPEEIVHKIIEELTGEPVTEPIKLEDFYYLYNEQEKYYYIVPVGTDWIHINEIKELRNVNNGEYYIITCSTVFSEDGITNYDSGDIKVILKYSPTNSYIRYQLVAMDKIKNTPN